MINKKFDINHIDVMCLKLNYPCLNTLKSEAYTFYEEGETAFTFIKDGRIIFACGMKLERKGVGRCWFIPSIYVDKYKISVVKTARKLIEDNAKKMGLHRVHTTVVPALIKRHMSGENPFLVWGSPDVVRDFLYVKDVVNGALLILEKGESMRPYNLGYGSGVTIGDIVDTILKVTGNTPEVIWDNSKPTTIPFRAVSTDRIQSELGFKPTYTFEEGMRETINWYKENKL